MNMTMKERRVNIGVGSQAEVGIDYLTAGEGPPLVLLHGLGDSAMSWQWVLPELARTHRVFAPSLPGFGTSAKPSVVYSPEFFTSCMTAFLDTLELEQAVVVGNSLGGLVALRLALAAPGRVPALGLVDSAGLGREVTPAMRLLTVGAIGTFVTAWNSTALGAWQWALGVSALLFAHPTRVPRAWLAQLYRMARVPGYLEATVATARSEITLKGQRDREILLDALPRLTMPVLVVWGERDRVVPPAHAQAAVEHLPRGRLALIPDSGHLPQVERPEHFTAALSRFLGEHVAVAHFSDHGIR